MLPEVAAAPDEVFPRPRLALVDTRGCPTPERGGFVRHVYPLLIHGVPGLVHVAEECLAQEVFLDARSDTHIAERELGHERMMRLVLPPAIEIVAQRLDDFPTESQLLRFGIELLQAAVIGNRLCGNRLHDRHQLCSKFRKQRPHCGDRHALVGEIDQRIGDVLISGKAIRQLPTLIECLFQIRLHAFEIVGRTRFRPDLIRLGAVFVELRHKRSRNLRVALVLAARHADQTGVIRIIRQTLFVRPQLIKQLAHGRIGKFLMSQTRQRRHLAAARRCSARRHVSGLIPA